MQKQDHKEMVYAYEGLRFSKGSVLNYAENVCGLKRLSNDCIWKRSKWWNREVESGITKRSNLYRL